MKEIGVVIGRIMERLARVRARERTALDVPVLADGHIDNGSRVGEGAILGGSCEASGLSDRDQHIAERDRRSITDLGLPLAADHRHHPDATSFLITMQFKGAWMDALFAGAPGQVWKGGATGQQPGRFVGEMAIVALLHVAGIPDRSRYPSARRGRFTQSERVPGLAVGRMLENAAPQQNRVQSRGETAIVIAKSKLVRLPSASMPKSAPTLTRGMSHDRVWPNVATRIPRDVPQIDSGQVTVATVRLDKQGGDHCSHPEKYAAAASKSRSLPRQVCTSREVSRSTCWLTPPICQGDLLEGSSNGAPPPVCVERPIEAPLLKIRISATDHRREHAIGGGAVKMGYQDALQVLAPFGRNENRTHADAMDRQRAIEPVSLPPDAPDRKTPAQSASDDLDYIERVIGLVFRPKNPNEPIETHNAPVRESLQKSYFARREFVDVLTVDQHPRINIEDHLGHQFRIKHRMPLDLEPVEHEFSDRLRSFGGLDGTAAEGFAHRPSPTNASHRSRATMPTTNQDAMPISDSDPSGIGSSSGERDGSER